MHLPVSLQPTTIGFLFARHQTQIFVRPRAIQQPTSTDIDRDNDNKRQCRATTRTHQTMMAGGVPHRGMARVNHHRPATAIDLPLLPLLLLLLRRPPRILSRGTINTVGIETATATATVVDSIAATAAATTVVTTGIALATTSATVVTTATHIATTSTPSLPGPRPTRTETLAILATRAHLTRSVPLRATSPSAPPNLLVWATATVP